LRDDFLADSIAGENGNTTLRGAHAGNVSTGSNRLETNWHLCRDGVYPVWRAYRSSTRDVASRVSTEEIG
jgi:hypothetical protein